MDAATFAKILNDKSIIDIKKLKYKYPEINVAELIELLKNSFYRTLPIPDYNGDELRYIEILTNMSLASIKLLLSPQNKSIKYGLKAMEDEISSTLNIEDIDFSRESVRKILKGYAPADESENRIYGIKRGLDFISDTSNKITEENIHTLYQISIGEYLERSSKLRPDNYYRHDSVYIVGNKVEHIGLPHKKLPEYMLKLISFINSESEMNDLLKAAVIHFYIAYLHPYFDGNGRIARLISLWYLIRQGYSAALFIPFSSYIEKSRRAYYNAFTLTETNFKISGVLDVTPFLLYFIENVYNKLDQTVPNSTTLTVFHQLLKTGKITEKERELWNFVLSVYGEGEFSTKQLEKEFGNAAYATIRGFVLKFEELGLLSSQKYGNRVKYRII
jgi:Fic family protein